MKQFIIKDIDYSLIINLLSNTNIMGTFVPIDALETNILDNIIDQAIPVQQILYTTPSKNISTYEEVIEHFTPNENKYFVTGVTDSKFMLIDKYIKKEQVKAYSDIGGSFTRKYGVEKQTISGESETNLSRVGIKCGLQGGTYGMILREGNEKEYVLYLDTPNPIKYIDLSDGSTIFSYIRSADEIESNKAQILLFEGVCDDPKIISDVFIDRGVNSVFEKFKKLKVVKDLNELTKIGLGFYKINIKGFDFKNK